MSTPSPKKTENITDADIEAYLESILVEQFEVDPALLKPDAHLFDDLGFERDRGREEQGTTPGGESGDVALGRDEGVERELQ